MSHLLILDNIPPQIIELGLQDKQPRTVIKLEDLPDGVDVDMAEGRIYWTNMGRQTGPNSWYGDRDGRIESCKFDGSDRQLVVGDGKLVTPKQLRIYNDRLYFCDREGMKVYSCSKQGELQTLVDTGVFGSGEEREVVRHCVGILPTKDYVYFTQKGNPDASEGRISRVPINGGSVEQLMSGLPEPIDLDIGKSGRLYWTDRALIPTGRSLNCADITAAGLQNHRIIFEGLGPAIGLTIDAAEKTAFVADLRGQVWSIDIASGKGEVIYRTAKRITGICLYSPRSNL